MKIGIMSMQRIHNYGSFLQAYGLKKIIENLGYEVCFVDYQFEKSIIKIKKDYISKIKNNLNIFNYLKKKRIINNYNNWFEKEYIPFLCGREKNYLPKNIDELVIGSDEVFNCLQTYPVGYSRQLFGYQFDNIPVISYAASFGQTNVERLNKYNISQEIGDMLRKFKSISVRDNNSFNTVYELTDIKPTVNLDPVLMYDFSKDVIDNVNIDNYIIVYAYPNRLTKKEERIIKKFAKKHNKKIVSLGMYQKIADIDITVNPFEVFAYFKHADFIITDTFHGSIFSIKTHSKFCTLIRNNSEGNSNKLSDLLNRLSLNECIINDISNIEDFYNKKIDYKKCDSILEKEKNNTINYLKNNIK